MPTMDTSPDNPPGAPGAKPTWAPAAKSGIGCALSAESNLWFTLGRGIVTEVYHPRIDNAAIRDFGLVVSGTEGFFSEEKSDCASDTRLAAPGVPAYRIENVCTQGRYRIVKDVLVDPHRSVLLQRVKFSALKGSLADLRLVVLLSPRLGDQGQDNSAWIDKYRSWDMLFARHDAHSLALASSCGWKDRSVGYVGQSDPWHDLRQNGRLTWKYRRADHGHVALAGEIDLSACNGEFVLSLSFDRKPEEAALNAMLSCFGSFEDALELYTRQWQTWHQNIAPLNKHESSPESDQQRQRPDRSRPLPLKAGGTDSPDVFLTSMMVLRTHRSKNVKGAALASLAVPWGEVMGDSDSGGYHLVWPRDLCEEAAGLLAGGVTDDVLDTLNYLRATQKPEGGWAQDMWLDSSAHARGIQLDEAALPVLLVNLAHREKALKDTQLPAFWPMIRSAAAFCIRSGPATCQDRWENAAGLSPYTIATQIAALLIAARLADRFDEAELANYFRETADLWNDSIESWTYVTGTEMASGLDIDGYYLRIAPPPGIHTILRGNRPHRTKEGDLPVNVVSADALALVRFGLRAPDDPRILNTLAAIDAITRVELPAGPCWHRYNGDRYGENDDGAPFKGKGDPTARGRAWPLLTGERGHYEIAAGNNDHAQKMLRAMEGFSSQIGLLPEQVWDSQDIPQRGLFRGRPSGSAMPLAWAHSEYVRLQRSIRDGVVFDRPDDPWQRYVTNKSPSDLALWRFDHQTASFPAGRRLRLEVMARAVVHFSTDGWETARDLPTSDPGIDCYHVDLPTDQMEPGETIRFTFRWPEGQNRWEGTDFELEVEAASH